MTRASFVRRALAAAALWAGASGRAGAQQLPPLTPLDAPPRASSMVLRIDSLPNALADVPVESLLPFARPNGMLLRAGTFVYQLSSRRDTLVTPLGQRTVVVRRRRSPGRPRG